MYHGTNIPNLKAILPNRSGYVHATPHLAFALIFASRERNSLIGKWHIRNGIPYFCERKEGIIDRLFEGIPANIYVLDGKNFIQKEGMERYEYVSDKEEKVIDEIVVDNIKESLLEIQNKGEFQFIDYKDREKYFPNIDKETSDFAIAIGNKYGVERAINDCKKWNPELIETVENEFKNI